MLRQEKSVAVAELTEKFRQSSAAVLTEYRGLTVAQLEELRTSLGSDTKYTVVKNTLTNLAAQEAGVDAFEGQLNGPSAIAFVESDPVAASKGLRDFAKTNPNLVIKGGFMDGRPVTAGDINKLADLESREVLLSKAAGVMKAKLNQAAQVFSAPASKAVRTIEALREKQENAAA